MHEHGQIDEQTARLTRCAWHGDMVRRQDADEKDRSSLRDVVTGLRIRLAIVMALAGVGALGSWAELVIGAAGPAVSGVADGCPAEVDTMKTLLAITDGTGCGLDWRPQGGGCALEVAEAGNGRRLYRDPEAVATVDAGPYKGGVVESLTVPNDFDADDLARCTGVQWVGTVAAAKVREKPGKDCPAGWFKLAREPRGLAGGSRPEVLAGDGLEAAVEAYLDAENKVAHASAAAVGVKLTDADPIGLDGELPATEKGEVL